MKLLKSIYNDISGFSLVEAIISVVIIGLAIIPISTVYTSTITRTTDSRKQLEANKLAEQYIEAIKDKPFSDFNAIFHNSDGLDYDSGDESFDKDGTSLNSNYLNEVGFEAPTDGYSVTIRYDNAPLYDAATTTPTSAAMAVVDGIVYIDAGNDQSVYFENGDGSSYTGTPATVTGTTRIISVVGERSGTDTKITVQHLNGSGNVGNTFSVTNPSNNAIRFMMDSDTDDTDTHTIDTSVEVESNLLDPMYLYFYEDDDNTIQATVDVNSGYVSVSRNLYYIEFNEPRITQIDVEVIDESSGEVLASLSSSKINE